MLGERMMMWKNGGMGKVKRQEKGEEKRAVYVTTRPVFVSQL